MSIPPPPHGYPPPGGYPPPQPGPYGPQHGQPTQHGPYGAPQQPWTPQPPHPHPGGWGAPPPPPKKNRTGLTLGIVAASIAGVLALGWAGNNLTGGGSRSFPKATHKLTLPRTLLSGEYTLAQDHSDKVEGEITGSRYSDVRDPKGIAAQYTTKGASRTIAVSGVYGRLSDPDRTRKGMLEGAAEADGAIVAVPAKDITPAGSDITVRCQVMLVDQMVTGRKIAFPMCAWADANTAVSVGQVEATTAPRGPESVDLDAAAANTLKVRQEMRKPIS